MALPPATLTRSTSEVQCRRLVPGDVGGKCVADTPTQLVSAVAPGHRQLAMGPRAREHSARLRITVGIGEIILLLALNLFLYADTIRLPFYSDDPVDMRWVERSTLPDIWTSAAGVGYYRPLPFTVWWADRWLAGGFHPSLEHAVNVVFHILNALLVVSLARRILPDRGPRWVGLVAGALFVSFPFSYQAIPWVASLTHPMATFFILGSVLTATRAAPGAHWSIRAASLAMAALAFFAHESAVVVGGLLACLALRPQNRLKVRDIAWPLAYVGLAVAFVLLYFSIPRQTTAIPAFTRARLTQNVAYVVQGLAYPVAPATRLLMTRSGWSDLASAYLAAGVTVALLVLLAWRGKRIREMGLALALAWFVIAVIPASLVLSYDYILNGPRVLYLASVGATVAWALGVEALASAGRRWVRVTSTATASLGLVAILVFSIDFVRERQAIHRMGGDLVWQVSETFSATPADGQYLVLNFPAWLAPGRLVYPLGHEGTEFMASYVNIKEMVWANAGAEPAVRAAKFSNSLPPWPGYFYGIRGPEVTWEGLAERIREADGVFVVHLDPDGPRMLAAGRLLNQGASTAAPVAVFDDRVSLVGGHVVPAADGTVVVRLAWHSEGAMTDADYRVFVHAYDEAGNVVSQADGYPLDGLYPFWIWRPGDHVEDLRHLRARGPSGTVARRFAVGIYDPASGERLAATGPDGERFALDAVPVAASSTSAPVQE